MSKVSQTSKPTSCRLLLPVILMMGFVPAIVHTYNYKTGLSQFDWFPNASESRTDVFFAWKMVAIIVVGIVMLGIFLFRYFKKKETLRFESAFYLLFFYAGFVAMSALFSPYKYWVARGTYELFESVWVVFAYIILCYYTYHFVQEEKQVIFLFRWAGIGVLIVTLIGAFQYFGLDFFQTSLGKHLITDSSFWNRLDEIDFVMGADTSYTTLYNPNFLSFYFGITIPVAVCLVIASGKMVHKIIFLAAAVLSALCMQGSHSDSGWLALAAGACFVVFVLLSRRKKIFYAGLGIAAAGFLVLLIAGRGSQLFTTFSGTYRMEERVALRSVETNEDNVVLDIRGKKILLSLETNGQNSVICTDENGTDIARTYIDEANLIEQIADASIQAECLLQPVTFNDETPGVRVTLDGRVWDFVRMPDDGYFYANPAGKLVKYEPVKTVNLFRDDALSGRGHIWNNTLPLLGKHILIGAGANAYMLDYPQNDYIYHAYISGYNNYDVKAHCWYLQQWVENGLIALLLLIGFLGWYVIRSIRIYRKASLDESLTWVGIGLFTAVLTYLTAAVANDSNVCTAPLFWGIMGLAMAVNRIIEETQGLKEVPVSTTENGEKIPEKKLDEKPQTVSSTVSSNNSTNGNSAKKKSGGQKNSGKKKSGKKKSRKK